ncbi:MAG: Gfo/Idh/MocA family oxidoreductase, partial [Phycisphaerales bacterium]|nr:Gfo/Idh/MocA family oxidoreductase [Phycisphaerales bacterium]
QLVERLEPPPLADREADATDVGVGGKGAMDLKDIASHPNIEIVAICDVDMTCLKAAGKRNPKARKYQDWREMFDKEADNIDSVSVSTPDHMHAPVAMRAMQLGKHVYCQKPLTHDVFEARQLKKIAAEKKLVTQMGTQFASSFSNRYSEKLIKEGEIGKVKEMYCWSNKDARVFRPMGPRPTRKNAVPATLDWDKWIGTAPMRPFVKDAYHPKAWRGWQDFGCGWLGDMGCHIMNTPFLVMDMAAPINIKSTVEPAWAKNPKRFKEVFPQWEIIEYTFPGNKHTEGDTIKLTWSDGGKYPPKAVQALVGGKKLPSQGMMAIGTEGVLLLPHPGIAPKIYPKKRLPRVKFENTNHYYHWVDAILKNDPDMPLSRFSFTGQLSEAISLGVISLRFPGQDLKWDSAAMKFTNVKEANALLKRTYRKGWEEKGL